MIFSDVRSFSQIMVKGKRIMGIDFGERTVGIAFTDRSHTISSPYSTYNRRNISKDMGYINNLFIQKDCTAIVMGLPNQVNAEDKYWVDTILAFVNKLACKYKHNIYLQDETFTTKEAKWVFKQFGLCNKWDNDHIAASCILNRTLDIIRKL